MNAIIDTVFYDVCCFLVKLLSFNDIVVSETIVKFGLVCAVTTSHAVTDQV